MSCGLLLPIVPLYVEKRERESSYWFVGFGERGGRRVAIFIEGDQECLGGRDQPYHEIDSEPNVS